MPHAPMDMYTALGKNGQFINVVPSQNLVLVRMGDSPDPDDVPFTFNDSIWEKMNDVMCGGTGIQTNTFSENELRLYPNPASEIVAFTSESNDQYRIINLIGEVIRSGRVVSGENKIELTGIESGVYVFQIGERKAKLVVNLSR